MLLLLEAFAGGIVLDRMLTDTRPGIVHVPTCSKTFVRYESENEDDTHRVS